MGRELRVTGEIDLVDDSFTLKLDISVNVKLLVRAVETSQINHRRDARATITPVEYYLLLPSPSSSSSSSSCFVSFASSRFNNTNSSGSD